MLARQAHQGQVGRVQIAHGGHECHPQLTPQLITQSLDGMDDFQDGLRRAAQAERV